MLKRAALRTMALLAFLTAVWTLVPGQQAKAALSGDFSYTDNGDGTAAITSYMGTDTDVIIPSVLEGLAVTGIGKDAFFGRNLASVTLPDTLTSIGVRAFGSNHLTSLTIPDSVMTIGDYAFLSNSLTSLTLSNGLKSIGIYAFTVNNKLTSVILPEGLEYVGDSAFYRNQLTHVTFPNSMTGIGSSAFRYNQITSIELPDHLESIGSYAFDGNKLTNIEIPESVKSIEHYAFINNALTQVTILGNATSIGGAAFVNNQASPGDLTFISYDPSPAKDYAVANGHTFHKLIPELSGLTLSEGSLSPVFASGSLAYTVSVTNSVYAITVTPTASYSTFAVTVNGTTVTSATASQAIPLNVGENAITVTVTAQDGTTTKSYTVTVTRAASNSADLTNLELSDGALSPAFGIGTTSYSATVANSVYKLTVTPTAADLGATIKVNGNTTVSGMLSQEILLDVGDNVIDLTVAAQDGITTKTYTVTVTRAASNSADLTNLKLSDGVLSPAFGVGTTSYAATVANSVYSLTVTPTTADPNATITVNGDATASGAASQAIPLNVGENAIDVTVTAQDGQTTKTYTVIVTCNSADSTPTEDGDPDSGGGGISTPTAPVNPTTPPVGKPDTEKPPEQPSGAACSQLTWTDVQNHWTKSDIELASELCIVNGPSNDKFMPDDEVTRLQFALMVARAKKLPAAGSTVGLDSFKDRESVPAWADAELSAAIQAGIIEGYEDGTLRPNEKINRAEMVTMLIRGWGMPASNGGTSFADDADIPDWAKGYVAKAAQTQIIEGRSNNRFEPSSTATRAEAVVVLVRILQDQP
ncbi:cadherin-like beta sandwich domain-containing protein [Paenibacillus ginsengarvi]|uniref:SLH domain-containing protein n=1 Tax=Paenibacillus ginsengarvi TaxID=400777 RepID=A0A3B0BDZ2_9BACL|nr:cadherin-like beta sandwich domain-containing protein [Paenibacillus ginsengarvi]RKN70538.1 hypothetical protein D7M11_30150 [Paenibacillus ginsengarvi]